MAKVGIITLPFNGNYGGLIQAACLYRHLSDIGHEVKLLNYQNEKRESRIRYFLRQALRHLPLQNFRGQRKLRIFESYAKKLMPNQTIPCQTIEQLNDACSQEKFDALIVGSDQVWRWDYIEGRENIFFLDFARAQNPKKISYGASFGNKCFPALRNSGRIPEMLNKFDSVSVRERSGIEICESLGRKDCKWVLDPTLLVSSKFFEDLVSQNTASTSQHLFFYILDRSSATKEIIDAVNRLCKDDRKRKYIDLKSSNSILDWISGFRCASFVVTDSYHGVIMSIIFRKPFIAIVNEKRGMDRFTSLLDDFDLSDRSINPNNINFEEISRLFSEPIDYELAHETISLRREESRLFLQQSLIL